MEDKRKEPERERTEGEDSRVNSKIAANVMNACSYFKEGDKRHLKNRKKQ